MNPVRRRQFLVGALALAFSGGAGAQSTGRVAVIGVLAYGTVESEAGPIAAFRAGLREAGLIEGQHVRFEYRYADFDFRKIDRIAEELAGGRMQVIYTPGPWGVHALKAATKTVPIVFSGVNDPVFLKFVESVARPGGNITGVSMATHDLTKKRIQLMREMFPSAGRLGVIYDEDMARACQIELGDIRDAAKQLGVEVRPYGYDSKHALTEAFERAQRARVSAVLIPTTMEVRRAGNDMVAHSAENRMPMMHQDATTVEAGGLMSYGPQMGWGPRRAANHVARILRGTRPADLPVEFPTSYELVINLKTARAMGIRVPQSVLARADRIIE